MTANIYGIDTNKPTTALMVRDAMVICFYEAHCAETGLSPEKHSPANKEYCRTIIKKAFDDTGGDFDKPDKKSIVAAMDNLAEFSKNFRKSEIIEKHYKKIHALLDKLK